MIPLPPLWPLLWTILVAAAILSSIWVVAGVLIRRSSWRPSVRKSALALVHGPVMVAGVVVTFSLVEARLYQASPSSYPPLLAPATVDVFLQLLFLWSVIAAATGAVRRHVITDQHPSGRYLIYGIYTAGLLAVIYVLLNSPEFPHVATSVWALLGFVVGIVSTYIVVHVVNIVLERYFQQLINRQPQLQTIYTFIRRLVLAGTALVGVGFATYTSFPQAAGTVTSLILAAGFLSIVIGLAAQSSISNMIAGALVSISQPFQIGDAVVYSGEFCFVEDIRLLFTVLRTWDNRRLMVPNSLFQSTVVINYSAVDTTMLAPLVIDITYESDMDAAMRIMKEEALKHPDCMPIGNLPQVVVMEYKDNGVSLRLLSRAKDQSTVFQMERDLLYSIRKRFQAEGVGLPYPTRRVILDAPAPTKPPAKSSTRTAPTKRSAE